MCQKMPANPTLPAPALPTLELGKMAARQPRVTLLGVGLSRFPLASARSADASSGYPSLIDHPPQAHLA
jgi:hypothetical protein